MSSSSKTNPTAIQSSQKLVEVFYHLLRNPKQNAQYLYATVGAIRFLRKNQNLQRGYQVDLLGE